MRLDVFLMRKYKISRSLAANLVRNNYVKINNNSILEPDFFIKPTDKIVIIKKSENITILSENEHYLVVKKPENMSVCRSLQTPKIENVLNELLRQKYHYTLSAAEKPEEFGLVHRLDKETSGLMLISKTEFGYKNFKQLFRDHKIIKIYKAFNGHYEKPQENFINFICPHGRINYNLLGKNECFCEVFDSFKNNNIISNTWQIFDFELENNRSITFLQQVQDLEFNCLLFTGRTHQIRILFEKFLTPIYGDKIYGNNLNPDDNLGLFSIHLAFFPLEY